MHIAFIVYEGLTSLDLVGPLEVLSRVPGATVDLVGARPGPITADNGVLQLAATASLAQVREPDVIVVPGGTSGTRRAEGDPELLAWLRENAPAARWVTSVCTGSLILGAAGLLQGRRATTHWVALDELRAYGATPVSDRVVVDGDVVTAAGVSAGIDMALTLTEELRGRTAAKLIQLAIEYDPDPPHQAGSPQKAGRALTAAARLALAREFRRPVPVTVPPAAPAHR